MTFYIFQVSLAFTLVQGPCLLLHSNFENTFLLESVTKIPIWENILGVLSQSFLGS